MKTRVCHYIANRWDLTQNASTKPVLNPATGLPLAELMLAEPDQINHAVSSAHDAFAEWRTVPVGERIQYLFKLKSLLEQNIDALAETITNECGKTRAESIGEIRRGIENVETACGMPMLMQGYNNEDIARGVDEHVFRQPLGVVAAITPFNFPAMIPLWFLPYAVAAGNCFILKPSERVPMAATKLFELIHEAGFPPGVLQLLHGGKPVVDALLEHPHVRAISFVGSTDVARYVYHRAAQYGKRAQCQGGAKNPVIVMPDCDMETTTRILADSTFGCAGQRCLATSMAITVGEARSEFVPRIAEAAHSRVVGFGLDDGVQMGPVITSQSRQKIEAAIETGARSGLKILVDGRNRPVEGMENGFWVRPTIIEDVPTDSPIASTELFGPVLGLHHADTLDEAIKVVNNRPYGNMACIFTGSGAVARRFRIEADAGNVGINIGVAAPMAYFPFSGWNDSFFGDLHAQGRHAVEFYTQTKVVVERWPNVWSRIF